MECVTDAPCDVTSSNSSTRGGARPQTEPAPELSHYNMAGEKYLYIFNHYKYRSTKYFHFKCPSTRTGTTEDVARLSRVYKDMNYNVEVYHDLDHSTILGTVNEISQRDHKATACLCFAFLTHGDKCGVLYAADREYLFTEVTTLVEHGHAGLVGKPKLFLLQACRGAHIDDGQRVEVDGAQASFVIPTQADVLVMYSTVEDYVAYRDNGGSFFIQELCKVIEEYHDKCDILQIATLVHMRVAYFRTTFAPNKAIHEKKQMPETRYTLTKLLNLI